MFALATVAVLRRHDQGQHMQLHGCCTLGKQRRSFAEMHKGCQRNAEFIQCSRLPAFCLDLLVWFNGFNVPR